MDKHTRLIPWRQNEFIDRNANGIDDEFEPHLPGLDTAARELRQRLDESRHSGPALAAGDIDARWEDGESGGEETVGGSSPTPDQDIVDEIGRAVGRVYADGEPLDPQAMLDRDRRRWELDPASADEAE